MPSSSLSLSLKYRNATIADLDPPPALSITPTTPLSTALLAAYEHDYTHLTIISPSTRALFGYLSIPRLRALLAAGSVRESDPVEAAMQRFRRKCTVYRVITPDTELAELEGFFDGVEEEPQTNGEGTKKEGTTNGTTDTNGTTTAAAKSSMKQDFAVVTDSSRKFVLGVVTRADLDEFVRRRPGLGFA